MIVVKKKIKRSLLIAILAAALALLTAVAILLNTLLAADSGSGSDTGSSLPDVDTDIGEVLSSGSALAYKSVKEADIQYIRVRGEREYSFVRADAEESEDKEDESSAESPFYLTYQDDNGETQYYLPPIMGLDPTSDYYDFYAVTQDDSFGQIYKLSYLCVAIGTLYFNDKLDVSPYYNEKDKALANYGLSDADDPIEIYFVYNDKDENGNEVSKSHKITVGDKLISGSGYYFTVDNRPIVYSTYINYLDYAFLNFTDYINPILTAAGLAQDNAFEPYLTTGFEQWKNTVYDTEGESVLPNSKVVLNAVTRVPDGSAEGYSVTKSHVTVDLANLGSGANDQRMKNAIMGSKVGLFASPVFVTLQSNNNIIEFAEKQTIDYKYEITGIEAILTDGGDITTAGTVVGDNNLIKITYRIYVDGVLDLGSHIGVLDISSDIVPDSVESELRSRSIGVFMDENLFFNVAYTSENAVRRNAKMIITEIIEIIDLEDMVTRVEKAEEGTRVLFRYKYVIDGVESETLDSDFVDITGEMTADERLVADAVMGHKVGEYTDLETEEYVMYAEQISDFTAYEFSSVEYFITSENIVAFKFEQASKRDPYYGESLYKNIMENKYAMYALNSGACEAVVEVLGGINDDATSSNGLIGAEVVDINITPEKLKKYGPKNSNKGLYAYTIYFELPRGITNIEYNEEVDENDGINDLDDYTYYSTLGFTLYVSEADPVTGQRYIASDLYDIIALVDGEDFVFLDQNFPDFYARKNLVMTDVANINSIKMEFFMSDVYGTYTNRLVHNPLYAYNGQLYRKEQLTDEELALASYHDGIEVIVTPEGDCIDTYLSEYIEKNGILTDENGNNYASLYELYDREIRDMDTEGTANFKEFIQILFLIEYERSLTEEEQAAAKGSECLMRMRVNLTGNSHDYVYEFSRISDRRVMVTIYQESAIGVHQQTVVSDFYISTFAFKKLVNSYFMVLNAETLNNDVAYPDGIKDN